MNSFLKNICAAGLLLLSQHRPQAFARDKYNFDEDKVSPYTLPDPLRMEDGTPVTDAGMWHEKRRPEILRLFETHVYGKPPAAPQSIEYRIVEQSDEALNGKAIRKQVEIVLATKPQPITMMLLLYVPKRPHPVPAFLGLNFWGNQATTTDPAVLMNANWMRDDPLKGIVEHRATEASRGVNVSRWPYEKAIDRGYAVGTIFYGDLDPDYDDGFQNGIHPAFYRAGQTRPAPDEWGSIGAWAWGLSRGLDYLEKDELIDAGHVAVIGHSRLGKTSLWAGATDPRFAIVIANDSGCAGAALSRRQFGQTVEQIRTKYGQWFCGNFQQYGDQNPPPVDQHQLISLIAPRPVYVASAHLDRGADPKGEFLGALHADPVYRLLGTNGMGGEAPPSAQPAVDQPLTGSTIGYHVRTGNHDITEYDWAQYLDFADRHFQHPTPSVRE
ncbi:glucuronyl esterase domain-containing protein [Planctomicrobium sp. SH664]|uniref:glucuronyl esterase domain-containing protein n=1 Tax=Planctomicrobium sp. SH664 TaxID=3448125 RepID=UPI003F5C01B9